MKLCFYLFLAGFSLNDIAEVLTDLGRKTGYNKSRNKKRRVEPKYNTVWTSGSVVSILRNERHCGDVLARKTYTPNFKDHKSVKNKGDRQQVLKRNHHDAIVPREVFEAANRKLDLMIGKQDRPYPTMKVVDEGALRGFVPVDQNWKGFSSSDYVAASKSVYEEEAQETADNRSRLANFQVVRAQLFSTRLHPAVTISSGKIRFNTACLKRFSDAEYVELLLNSVEKKIAVRPCDKGNPNAIRWGSLKDGKWIVSEKSCRGLSGPLFELMDWNKELKYRMRGEFHGQDGNCIMVFDLDEPEVIERVLVEAELPTQPDETPDENTGAAKPKYRNVMTFRHGSAIGHRFSEDSFVLKREHYAGNWDVLRPAREVFGVNPITESEI